MLEELATSGEAANSVARMMRLLSDPTRLRLIGLLHHEELNVTMLCRRLTLPQPTVSHHLALLREAGLVSHRRDGKQVFYSLRPRSTTWSNGRPGLAIEAGSMQLELHPNGRRKSDT